MDNSGFQKTYSLLNTIQRIGGDGWSQSLTDAYTAVRYGTGSNPNTNLRDINQILLSSVLTKASNRNMLSISLFYGDDKILRNAGRNSATDFVGAAISDQFLLKPQHILFTRISAQNNDHKGLDPIFSVNRTNQIVSSTLGWIWQPKRGVSITTDFTFIDNESAIDLYSYDRKRIQTDIRFQF